MRFNQAKSAKAGSALAVVFVVVVIAISCGKQLRRTATRGDIEVYVYASRLMLAGRNIYTIPETRGGLYYLYPPLLAVLTIPFTLFPIEIVIILWCVLSVLLVAWIVVAFYEAMTGQSFFALSRKARWVIGFFPLLLTVRSILYHLDLAQANILMLAVAVVGLKVLSRGEKINAGVAIGISIILKVITLPLAILFLARRDMRVVGGIVLGSLAGLLLPALLLGFERNWSYLDYWLNNVILSADLRHSVHWPLKFNYSPAAQLYRFFGDAAAFEYDGRAYYFTIFRLPNQVIRLAGQLITCLVGSVVAFYGARYRNRSELVGQWGGVALAFSLAPAFSIVAQKHYFVLLLPAHIYVVYLWYCLRLKDKWFRGLVAASFIVSTLSTSIFGYLPGEIFSNAGGLVWGVFLLSAAIFRAAGRLPPAERNGAETNVSQRA